MDANGRMSEKEAKRAMGTRMATNLNLGKVGESTAEYWARREIDASRKHKKRLSRAFFKQFVTHSRPSAEKVQNLLISSYGGK